MWRPSLDQAVAYHLNKLKQTTILTSVLLASHRGLVKLAIGEDAAIEDVVANGIDKSESSALEKLALTGATGLALFGFASGVVSAKAVQASPIHQTMS